MNKKRFTIGLQSTMYHSDYMKQIVDGIQNFCVENDLNLLVFSGKHYNCPWNYEYENNVVYEYINQKLIDALIVPSATINNFLSYDEFKEIIYGFKGFPVISIGIPFSGIPSVIIDNKTGLHDEINHFIQHHGYNKIGFIQGPRDNIEAMERYNIYQKTLEENGIPFNPDYVVPGDFTPPGGIEAARVLLEDRKVKLDALIGANDDSIIGAARFYKNKGFNIPKDIAIGGFDNSLPSKNFLPPLTTVLQPLGEISKVAAKLALDLIQGKKVPPQILVPTQLIIRSSCGCLLNQILTAAPEGNHKSQISDLSNIPIIQIMENAIDRSFLMDNEKAYIFRTVQPVLIQFDSIINHQKADIKIQINNFLGSVHDHLLLNYQDVRILQTWQNFIFDLEQIVLFSKDEECKIARQSVISNCKSLIYETILIEQRTSSVNLLYELSFYRDSMSKIISAHKLDELIAMLNQELHNFGFETAYITLYDKTISHNLGDKWVMPKKAKLVLGLDQNKPVKISQRNKYFNPQENIIPLDCFPAGRRWSLSASPIFNREVHMGIIILEITNLEGILYESFTLQLNSIFHETLLFDEKLQSEKKLRKVLLKLEEANAKLGEMSVTDELTGLYNRRGFMSLAGQNFDLGIRMKKSGIVFFFDLDGLKKINDTYGHDEGDFAIKEAGNALKNNFRKTDIISRLGGDEFTVLAIDCQPDFFELFNQRFQSYLDNLNAKINKPYFIAMSMGAVSFTDSTQKNLEQLMAEADQMLYEQKKAKKATR